MTNTDNNYYVTEEYLFDRMPLSMIRIILKHQESIRSIREYLAVMENEPEGYIKMSEVYHSIRKMLNDE